MKFISNLLNNEAWRSVVLVVIGFLLAQLIKAIAQAQIKAAPVPSVSAPNIGAATVPQIPQGQNDPTK
jgi:hypothetical protein